MTDSFSNSVSIIVPTLNEEENIVPLVSEITACAVPFREILFVDDHSSDATRDKIHALAGSWPIRLIEQDGAGPGLRVPLCSARGRHKGEIWLVRAGTWVIPAVGSKDWVARRLTAPAALV